MELSGGGMDHPSALGADPILVRVDTESFRLLLFNQYLFMCLKYMHTYIYLLYQNNIYNQHEYEARGTN